jgi:hypothetical protein
MQTNSSGWTALQSVGNGGARSVAAHRGDDMKTARAHRNPRSFVFGAIAVAIAFFACLQPMEAQSQIPAAQTVWQHVGRIYLNPNTGKAIYAGYVVHLNGVSDSLFNGSPGVGTAYFTFSTDVISLSPMPANADLTLFLVSSGTFNVYYNPNPAGDWNNPATFSSGQLIATFKRDQSLFPFFTTLGVHSLSETLGSSHAFNFNGQILDMGRMVPNGITFASYFSATPQTVQLSGEFSDYSVAYAAAGSTIAVGGACHP